LRRHIAPANAITLGTEGQDMDNVLDNGQRLDKVTLKNQ
jgi:hypothetical protein